MSLYYFIVSNTSPVGPIALLWGFYSDKSNPFIIQCCQWPNIELLGINPFNDLLTISVYFTLLETWLIAGILAITWKLATPIIFKLLHAYNKLLQIKIKSNTSRNFEQHLYSEHQHLYLKPNTSRKNKLFVILTSWGLILYLSQIIPSLKYHCR